MRPVKKVKDSFQVHGDPRFPATQQGGAASDRKLPGRQPHTSLHGDRRIRRPRPSRHRDGNRSYVDSLRSEEKVAVYLLSRRNHPSVVTTGSNGFRLTRLSEYGGVSISATYPQQYLVM